MKKRTKIFIAILIILVLAGLLLYYFYNPKKALTLILPDLSRITYINANIKKDSIRTKIDLVVQNKSPYKLTIESIYFDVQLDGKLLVRQTVPINLEQARHQVDTVKLPVDVSRRKLKQALDNLNGKDSTDISAQFRVKYNTIFGLTTLEYEKEMRIPVPIPPKIKVLKVERKNYSLAEKTLSTIIQLQIINEGRNIDLQLRNIHYQMQVENELRAEGTINKTITVRPRSTETIEVPVDIKIEHPLKTIVKVITDNDQMNYQLHMQAIMTENMVDGIKKDSIPVEINASGKLELKK